jgi:hypothetical protein
VDTADGEGQAGLGGAAASGHCQFCTSWNTRGPRMEHAMGGGRENLRLRVLGTTGLAAGLSASSHFGCVVGWLVIWEKWLSCWAESASAGGVCALMAGI